MSETIHGACLCGQVTFDVHRPGEMSVCHCTRCQRWGGGASSSSVEVEGTDFEVTAGQELIKHFTQEGFSGVGFCSNCGSSLYGFGDGKYYVSAGTFPGLALQAHYHMMVAYKAPWDEISGDAPQYPEYPPGASAVSQNVSPAAH